MSSLLLILPPFASLTYQLLMSSFKNQRKVPKNPLNIGIALSLFISCGPAPKVQLSYGTIPRGLCVMGVDLCKTQKGKKVKIKG